MKTGSGGANGSGPGSGYAPVNGLRMYYEIHGPDKGAEARSRTPLLLLHGALSTIGTSFGGLLPAFAQTRRLLGQLSIGRADVLGYSLGAGIALQLALRHPDAVRKLVLASVTYNSQGVH